MKGAKKYAAGLAAEIARPAVEISVSDLSGIIS